MLVEFVKLIFFRVVVVVVVFVDVAVMFYSLVVSIIYNMYLFVLSFLLCGFVFLSSIFKQDPTPKFMFYSF